jgi:hypothetical protein
MDVWRDGVMDPISLIVTALVAGATTASSTAANQAIQDVYGRLKSLILRRFGGDPERRRVLEDFQKDPLGATDALERTLVESGLQHDVQALQSAYILLQHRDPEGAARGTYTVRVGGNAQGIVVGDRNRVTFRDPLKGET